MDTDICTVRESSETLAKSDSLENNRTDRKLVTKEILEKKRLPSEVTGKIMVVKVAVKAK